MTRRAALLFAALCLGHTAFAAKIFQLLPSNRSFGPDGPWQAIQVGLGTPKQTINLYPVAIFNVAQSEILAPSVCDNFPGQVCGTGGTFDGSNSETFDNDSVAGYIPYSGEARSVLDTLTLLPGPDSDLGQLSVPDYDIALFPSDNVTFPDGTAYPVQLGSLNLAQFADQALDSPAGSDSSNGSGQLVPASLSENETLATNSWGWHSGSGALNMPMSLWLGGYDPSRLVGPVAVINVASLTAFDIELSDIGLGVDNGESPFSFQSKSGIIPPSAPLQVEIASYQPYLQLPPAVCSSITQNLPVTLNTKLGLYIWNTSDPQYSRIVQSPTYLSFSFSASNLASGNLTVKVPFQLLNLTLEPPLVSTPTQYFPCSPYQPTSTSLPYTLGQSFLQAAFFGVNWDNWEKPPQASATPQGQWYLAQAPGPNIPSTPSAIPYKNGTFSDGYTPSGNWSETWSKTWKPLSADSSPSSSSSSATSTSSPGSGGLSGGAKAGIAIGVIVGVAAIAGAVAFLFFRSRKSRRSHQDSTYTATPQTENKNFTAADWLQQQGHKEGAYTNEAASHQIHEAPEQGPAELHDESGALSHELPSTPGYHPVASSEGTYRDT